jgi:lipopolysaccharide export system protein LptA
LNLPSRDNTTDIADINAISDNFEIIDGAFLDLVEKEIPKLQTKENMNLNFDDDSTYEEQYPSVPAVVNFTNRKVDPLKIVNSASGNAIAIKDSAKDKLVNLKLYGKTTQNGTPTPTSPIELKSVGDSGSFEVGVFGKNLLKNKQGTQTGQGVTFTYNNGDKSYTLSGTCTGTILQNIGKAYLVKGTSYTVTGCASGGATNTYLIRVTDSKNTILAQDIGEGETFTATETGYHTVGIRVQGGTVTDGLTFYPMVRYATETDGTYEPCNKQTLTMPYTLRGVGDIADEKNFARGVLKQSFGVYTVTGNENMSVYGSVNENGWVRIRVPCNINSSFVGTGKVVLSLCDKYSLLSADELSVFVNNQGTGYYYSFTSSREILFLTQNTTIEDFRNEIAGTTIIYQLATPIETPLSETELNAYRQLHTNKPTTTILSEAEMLVDYVADPKNYIDNKIAELTALTLEG